MLFQALSRSFAWDSSKSISFRSIEKEEGVEEEAFDFHNWVDSSKDRDMEEEGSFGSNMGHTLVAHKEDIEGIADLQVIFYP